jgi:hypothetical protein
VETVQYPATAFPAICVIGNQAKRVRWLVRDRIIGDGFVAAEILDYGILVVGIRCANVTPGIAIAINRWTISGTQLVHISARSTSDANISDSRDDGELNN